MSLLGSGVPFTDREGLATVRGAARGRMKSPRAPGSRICRRCARARMDAGRPRGSRMTAPMCMVTLVALVTGCERASQDVPWSIRDSAGVSLVTNFGDDIPLTWRLDSAVTIGGEGEGPGAFYSILEWGSVGADANGNVYVLDTRNRRIVSFDSVGQFRYSAGTPGQGPGEFERAMHLSVSPEGHVAAYDWAKQSLVRFDSSGVFQYLLHLDDISYDGRQLQLVGEDVVFTRWPPGGVGHLELVVRSADGRKTVLSSAVTPVSTETVTFERCGLELPLGGPIFTHELFWFATSDRIYVTPGPSYRIDVYQDGDLHTRIARDVAGVPATRAMAEREVADGLTLGACTVPANEIVDGRGFVETVPALSRFVVSPVGEIWAGRRGSGPEGLVDIFRPDGTYVGTMPPGTPLPVTFIGPSMVGVIRTDSVNVQRLELMRVVR